MICEAKVVYKQRKWIVPAQPTQHCSQVELENGQPRHGWLPGREVYKFEVGLLRQPALRACWS